MTEPLDDAQGELLAALKQIAALNITPDTGTSVALRMRDIAYNALNARRAATARCDAESTGLATFTPITGPGVDALENRKEADNGPSEEQVNADLRRYLVPPPSEARREAIARIIDPTAKFDQLLGVTWSRYEIQRRDLAYAKADAILALSPDPGAVAVAPKGESA